MTSKIFIPVSDELLYARPDLINTPLQPYQSGMACYHWLDVSLNPEDDSLPAHLIASKQFSSIDLREAA